MSIVSDCTNAGTMQIDVLRFVTIMTSPTSSDKSPGINPSILQHGGIGGEADVEWLNTVEKSPNSPCYDALLTTSWIRDPLLLRSRIGKYWIQDKHHSERFLTIFEVKYY